MNSRPPEMTFDQLQRYRLAAEMAEARRDRAPESILDGGSREGFLRHYLPGDRVVNLDRDFFRGDNFVQGDVLRLPFADRAFDLAVSLDVLEHIPRGRREDLLEEMARVSRRGLILGAPFQGEEVEEAERLAGDFSLKISGRRNEFIIQHRREGLPRLSEVLDWGREKGYRTAVVPNGFLPRWLAMICLNEYLGRLPDPWGMIFAANRLYHQRFYREDNADPAYRRMILFTVGEDAVPGEILSRLSAPVSRETPPAGTFPFLEKLLETVEGEKDNLIRELGTEKRRLESEFYRVARELEALKATYAYRAYRNTLGRLAGVFRKKPARRRA